MCPLWTCCNDDFFDLPELLASVRGLRSRSSRSLGYLDPYFAVVVSMWNGCPCRVQVCASKNQFTLLDKLQKNVPSVRLRRPCGQCDAGAFNITSGLLKAHAETPKNPKVCTSAVSSIFSQVVRLVCVSLVQSIRQRRSFLSAKVIRDANTYPSLPHAVLRSSVSEMRSPSLRDL